jgi:hypothetical protein
VRQKGLAWIFPDFRQWSHQMSAAGPTDLEREQASWLRLQAQIRLAERQARWEPWKALAAMVASAALFVGGVLALSNWIGHQPQQINVHLDAPLIVPQR